MEAELDHPAYLYRYGLYIGKDETESAHFLHSLTKQQMQAMADTFTEGYRIGFETTGKIFLKVGSGDPLSAGIRADGTRRRTQF